MAQMLTGKCSTRTPSRPSGLETAALPLWALPALGVIVALLHRTLDFSLGLPGHHGLEWMTVLLFARLLSPGRWACLMVAAGAAGGDLVLAADLMHT